MRAGIRMIRRGGLLACAFACAAAAGAAPAAPTSVTLSNPSLYTLTLSWTASAPGSDPAAGYQVMVSSRSNFDLPVSSFNNVNMGSVTSALISGLYPGTTYYVEVRAYDASGSLSAYSAPANAVTSGVNVPAEFEVTWSSLTAAVQEFRGDVKTLWNGTKQSGVDYGAEIYLSDCNRGLALLTNQARATVLAEIRGLQSMGMSTVQTCMSFPLTYQPYFDWAAQNAGLDTTTVNADGYATTAQNFMNFYVWISTTVHSMNVKGAGTPMKLSIETHPLFVAGAQVSQPALPQLTTYFTQWVGDTGCNGNYLNYESARASAAVTIAQLVQPDYLELQTEPANEGGNTGCLRFSTPGDSDDADLIALMVTSLTAANAANDFGLHSRVKITAGIGNWNYPGYKTTLLVPEAQMTGAMSGVNYLDFLDMHIYPINNNDTKGNNFISKIMGMVNVAKTNGIPIAMSLTEVWPHTNNDSELPGDGGQASAAVQARDLYCFWAPYYQDFFTTLAQLANYAPIAMMIPFNDYAFFGCADYYAYNSPPCSSLPAAQQDACYLAAANAAQDSARTNYRTHNPALLTPTGQAYAQIIANNGLGTPAISSLNPSAAVPGSGSLILAVTGSGFGNGSVIRWNGVELPTVYGGPTQLFATVPAADLATAGTAQVTVFNLGGGPSAQAAFTIGTAPPVLIQVNPEIVTVGGPDFILTAYGSNFAGGASIFWNGSARATTFVGANQLQATILASDIAALGTADVMVANPGGVSATRTLTVTIVPPLTDLSGVRVYPNPWRSDQGVPQIVFDHLTSGSTVKIFDLAGRWVRTLTPDAVSGTWDLTNDSGKKVSSGLYFYLITDSSGNKTRGKLTLIK